MEKIEADTASASAPAGFSFTTRGKQRRHLRGLGVALKPAVFLGKAAVSDAVVTETKTALAAHELIKVKLLENVNGERHEVAQRLAAAAGAELVQVIGRTALLYLPNPEKPGITLPA